MEKAQEHFEIAKNGLNVIIGLVEEDMPSFGFEKKSKSQNLVFLQKSNTGALFSKVRGNTFRLNVIRNMPPFIQTQYCGQFYLVHTIHTTLFIL